MMPAKVFHGFFIILDGSDVSLLPMKCTWLKKQIKQVLGRCSKIPSKNHYSVGSTASLSLDQSTKRLLLKRKSEECCWGKKGPEIA